ncbi:hypothetical protein [Cupriavidus neocaledonicus]|nr:hypothetical protein [Cupriavidus neocaledonicus]
MAAALRYADEGEPPIVSGIEARTTKDLLMLLRTAMDSPGLGADAIVSAWALHVNLTRRGVPPCLRPDLTDELLDRSKELGTFANNMRYVSWLADLLWIASHHPNRDRPILYKGISPIKLPAPLTVSGATMGLRQAESDSPYERPPLEACKPETMTPHARLVRNWLAWHARVGDLWSKAHRLQPRKWAWNFALSHDETRELGYILSGSPEEERKALRQKGQAAKEVILKAAHAAPDKSGACTPEDVARRRFNLLRLHILAGRSGTRTARYAELVGGVDMVGPEGKPLTRQAIMSHLHHVKLLTGLPDDLKPDKC